SAPPPTPRAPSGQGRSLPPPHVEAAARHRVRLAREPNRQSQRLRERRAYRACNVGPVWRQMLARRHARSRLGRRVPALEADEQVWLVALPTAGLQLHHMSTGVFEVVDVADDLVVVVLTLRRRVHRSRSLWK